MRIITLLLFLLNPVSAFCQVINEVFGTIVDKERKEIPLKDVTVYLNVQGQKITYTDKAGNFSINTTNLGVDTYGQYEMTFIKPGYNKLFTLITFPIRGNIELTPNYSGYIQVFNSRNNTFLRGIQVNQSGVKTYFTDQFGLYSVDIPSGVPDSKSYTISFDGGCLWKDTTVTYSVEELKNTVLKVYLSENLNYNDLIDCFDNELKQYGINLEKGDKNLIRSSHDKLTNILNRVKTLPKLSANQQAEARERVKIMNETMIILNDCKSADYILEKHQIQYKEYILKENQYINGGVSLKNVPNHLEEMITYAFQCLELSIKRRDKCPFVSNNLILEDIKRVKKLLLHAVNLKNDLEKQGTHSETQEKLSRIINENEEKLKKIIKNKQ